MRANVFQSGEREDVGERTMILLEDEGEKAGGFKL
jgi:hypothetical protein